MQECRHLLTSTAFTLLCILCILTGAVLVTRPAEEGEPLALLSPYFPGGVRPTSDHCYELIHYTMNYSTDEWQCSLTNTADCARLFVTGRAQAITSLSAQHCTFRFGDVLRHLGTPTRTALWSRSTVIWWPHGFISMSRQQGRRNPLNPINYLILWRAAPVGP